jgi:hypothetical protein
MYHRSLPRFQLIEARNRSRNVEALNGRTSIVSPFPSKMTRRCSLSILPEYLSQKTMLFSPISNSIDVSNDCRTLRYYFSLFLHVGTTDRFRFSRPCLESIAVDSQHDAPSLKDGQQEQMGGKRESK